MVTARAFPMAPEIQTERLRLRAPQREDILPWCAYLITDRAQGQHGLGPVTKTSDCWRVVAMMAGHWALHGYGPFVLEHLATGRALGVAGPFFPLGWPERELNWALWDPDDEGQGYATEAARAVIHHCFVDLNWTTLVSYIDPDDQRSIDLAARLGSTQDTAAQPQAPASLVYRHPSPSGIKAPV